MDNSEATGIHLLAEPPTADNTVRNSPRLDFTDTYRWIGSPGSHTSSIYTSSPCPGCNRYLNFDNGLTKLTMNSSAVEFEFKGDFQNWPNLDMVFIAPAVTSGFDDGTDIVLDMRGQYWNGSSSAIRSAKITHEVEDDGASSLNFKIQGDTNRMTILSGGNVGIGTTSPVEKLDIAGTAQMTGFKMPTGAATGYVLTSDASGVGTWQEATASAGADEDWAYSSGSGLTGEIYHTGDVGIGTATPDPSAKLEVASTTQGFLPPRMTAAQRDAIPSPANALIIFNTTTDCLQIYNHSAWNSIWCYSCAPSILLHPSDLSICDGVGASFYITAEGADLAYRWQVNTGTGWTDLSTGGVYSGVNTATLNISSASIGMDGYQYRCIVSGSCSPEATSATATLSVYIASVAATSVTADDDLLCTGESTTLRIVGGSLGDGAAWKWYSGSCGGTYVGTGDTLFVTPVSTTTYYVRAEGTCNTTICRSKSITVTSSISIGVQYYTTPGTYTFTVPADVTSVSVAAVGGGGGGCGHLGGMGGDPDAVPGEAGGNSSFGGYVTAYGGAGGGRQYDPAAVGGGYSGPNGYSGGNGGTLYGGGGGGAATFTGNGGNGGIGSPVDGVDGADGGNSGGAGSTGSYGIGGSGGGIYLTGTPNTGEAGQYGIGGRYGGGGGGSSINAGGGGGGAGGGLVWQNNIAVTPGENITVVVGEGGESGASYAADGQCGAVRIIWEYPCSPEANYPDNAD